MPIAIVLAGGVGSRLSPLTRIVPKPLIPFAGMPLIEYIVESLRRRGFNEVIITARYLGDQLVKWFQGREGIKTLLVDSKDTADAVRLVSSYVKGDFIVSMGDVVTDMPYNEFYKYHLDHGQIASIALKEVDNPLPYGLVYMDPSFNIVLFSEKPPSLEIYILSLAFHRLRTPGFYSNLVNAGIYAFKEELLDILSKNPGLMDFGRHVFPFLLESGYRIKGWIVPHHVYWNDIGRPETYKEALWDFLDNRIPEWRVINSEKLHSTLPGKQALLEGTIYKPIYIGENVEIQSGAIVGPYVDLERNVHVGSSVHISHSIIWSNTTLHRGARVYDSIIMNNVVVREGVKIVSSIVGTGCIVESDLVNTIVEPCTKVSPYEDSW